MIYQKQNLCYLDPQIKKTKIDISIKINNQNIEQVKHIKLNNKNKILMLHSQNYFTGTMDYLQLDRKPQIEYMNQAFLLAMPSRKHVFALTNTFKRRCLRSNAL